MPKVKKTTGPALPEASCPVDLRFYSQRQVRHPGFHVVMLYSQECPHCVETLPELKRFSQALCNKGRVYTVEVNHFPQVADNYNVENLPTIVAIKNGVEVARIEGQTTANDLWRELTPHMGAA